MSGPELLPPPPLLPSLFLCDSAKTAIAPLIATAITIRAITLALLLLRRLLRRLPTHHLLPLPPATNDVLRASLEREQQEQGRQQVEVRIVALEERCKVIAVVEEHPSGECIQYPIGDTGDQQGQSILPLFEG
jgi:hypothetical protein